MISTASVTELDRTTIEELRPRLRGPLLAAGDLGYDDARLIWNAMIDWRPGAIARCLGVADIVASVQFARERGLELSIKGGGHNISGLAVCDRGLMIDLSLMRGVFVDRSARVAHVQPGCLIGDVDRETQLHGLAAVLGFVSNTGAAGLTLGGGFGYLTRRFGYSSDNLLSLDVVTADGHLVRASEQENSDLFWGLRGGGGNFGVVTNFDYKLHPVGPEIVAGAIAWPGEDAPKVLELWRAVADSAPPELVVVAALRNAPPAAWISKEFHGKPIVALFVCHTGSIADGEKLLAPIKTFGSPVGDVVQRRPYASQQSLLDATQPKGRRYYWKSEYLPRLEPEMIDTAIGYARRIRSPHSAIVIFPLGGALNKLADDHSAVGNRDVAFVLNITSSWEKAEDDAANIEWARAAWRDMRRFSTGGTYVNFLTEEEGSERIKAAYGKNHARLVELKTRWDPTNLFRLNKNIAPQPG
ncbi:MAG TPA: FAD-binding oxidoreductase [Candidatus Limnocylindria bacterium]|jgi:FAD/FMN-containing dehydrogenase|nr:FAD-binding oxidoreductase [Candidatus Limnocylindria bacterium]